jgi:hypothetical protein
MSIVCVSACLPRGHVNVAGSARIQLIDRHIGGSGDLSFGWLGVSVVLVH